ncbi:MAG TPA: hypothetical protein VIV40_26270 [Kofleriaceae bacterium]
MYRALLILLVACRTVEPAQPGADARRPDAPPDANAKSVNCASTFGNALTDAFGRLDGTLLAVVYPGDERCAMPNATHVIVEITMGGAAYRMVVNVLSTSNDPHVWLDETFAPLAGEPWAEGWHPGVALDYVATLAVSKASFIEANQDEAIGRLDNALAIGSHISVYATSSGGSSAHLVHRNLPNADGAIVIDPDTAPRYLLSAFPQQQF